MFTPKQRMINAYRGIFSDRYPVAPEFWYYYPAKVLGVNMIEFTREVPFWEALKVTFNRFDCEGWGVTGPEVENAEVLKKASFTKISNTQYREVTTNNYKGHELTFSRIYDLHEPFWFEKHIADEENLSLCIDMSLSEGNRFDFKDAVNAYEKVGESYLLEMGVGQPFFDFIADMLGFERAVEYFLNEDEGRLAEHRDRYIEYQRRYIKEACEKTPFESFFIGCSYSCNSLIGPKLWRHWDKPYIKAVAEELHKYGKLLHIHLHGKVMETVEDLVEMGVDCVCPFERGPGGDVDGIEGLREVRRMLKDSVTMNGNIHTVETLIRGTEVDVRREVKEVKQAFTGSPRLIIGSGDQIGRETPEENLLAMIDEAKRKD